MERFSKILSRKKLINTSVIHKTELSRCLTKFDLTSLGVATTLGAGIYVLTGTLARNVAGPGLVLSFFVAAVASILAGLCYAEFASRVPRVGSAYTFSYVTIGEFCAFVIGWNLLLEYIIATSSVARAWSSYLDASLLNDIIRNTTTMGIGKLSASGIIAHYPDFLAFLLILVVTVTLCFGAKLTSVTTNVITAINIVVIVLIIILGASFAEEKNWTDDFLPFGFSGVLAASASAFYAFVGFDVIATAVEESNNPSKDVPVATILTIGICFVAYFGVSAVLTLMWPYYKLSERSALPEVFAMRGAEWAKYIIAVGALCGLSASLIGALFPLPRMLYAMASDGLIFKFLAKVHPKTEIPVIATVLSGALAAFLALVFDLQALVEMMSIGTLLAYTIVALCVLLLRYQPGSIGIVKGEENIFSSNDENVEGEAAMEHTRLTAENNGPTLQTARLAAIGIYCNVAIYFFISTLLIWGGEAILKGRAWAIFMACLLGIFLVTFVVLLVRQPQNKTPIPFKVPCVPAIPLFSIFVNIFLIMKLNYLTWLRFAVWMAIGLSIYIFYGLRHSVEGQRQTEQEGYVPLEQIDGKGDQEKGSETPEPKN
ncbi:cationic amino acid transporter 3-like isoform X2 [Orbicella faveolata]|uniref:cationic amino acid transporter 3-like isoform X2 n=1 Tax=Orbicella faveolata TaxID=48498 RepID=UPI0009E28389|nr:cationic amino acid transporter 3-like isoform X2 [Orbicella faveolata]XP_020621893.1 cationic amino acid transporter 3-like isoform X2 [Orbicella faveolata]